MADTYYLSRDESQGTAGGAMSFARTETSASLRPGPFQRDMPAAMEESQAYYWTYTWQEGELESRRELEAGEGVTFDSGADAVRWLLSDDE